MIDRKGVWIRLGGNAKNIKAGGKEGWRCFISELPITIPSINDEIALVNWKLTGTAVADVNFIPGTFSFGQSSQTPILVAWIDLFGDIRIDGNKVAYIELKRA